MGVRPHDLHLLGGTAAENDVTVRGIVEVVEHTGSEIFTEVLLDSDQRIMARLSRDAPVAVGEKIDLCFNGKSAHVFAKESGDRAVIPTSARSVVMSNPPVRSSPAQPKYLSFARPA